MVKKIKKNLNNPVSGVIREKKYQIKKNSTLNFELRLTAKLWPHETLYKEKCCTKFTFTSKPYMPACFAYITYTYRLNQAIINDTMY